MPPSDLNKAVPAQISHFLIKVVCTYASCRPAATSHALKPAPPAGVTVTSVPKTSAATSCTFPAWERDTIILD